MTSWLCSSNCRRAGSAPGSIVYMFDKSEVTIDDPKDMLKSYKDSDTNSGNTIIRQFCSNCGWWVECIYSKVLYVLIVDEAPLHLFYPRIRRRLSWRVVSSITFQDRPLNHSSKSNRSGLRLRRHKYCPGLGRQMIWLWSCDPDTLLPSLLSHVWSNNCKIKDPLSGVEMEGRLTRIRIGFLKRMLVVMGTW